MDRGRRHDGMRVLVLIPAFDEAARVGDVVRQVLQQGYPVVVIDDGSRDGTADRAAEAGATVLRLPVNQGKGAALHRGFAYAMQQEVDAVVTMDADGQHDPADVPSFFIAYSESRALVLIGNRMDDPGAMPFLRMMTNRFLSRLLSRTMGQDVPDTQNGFRLYAAEVLRGLAVQTTRFAAESEILLALARRGVALSSIPVVSIYGDEESRIRPLRDTVRFVRMYLRVRGAGRSRVATWRVPS